MCNDFFFKKCLARTVQTKFDASTLHSNPALAAETQMVDDGSGKVEVAFHIFNFRCFCSFQSIKKFTAKQVFLKIIKQCLAVKKG